MAKKKQRQEPAPTLEDLILLRDEVAKRLEQRVDEPIEEGEFNLLMVQWGLRLGYIIAGSIVSIAESQRVLAAQAMMEMQEPEQAPANPMEDIL